jgi:hypothetical protein
VDRHALTCQQRPQGLRHAQRGRLRNRVAGRERQRRERHQRQVVDDGSFGALQHRQERPRNLVHAKEIDGEGLLDDGRIAQIVIRERFRSC